MTKEEMEKTVLKESCWWNGPVDSSLEAIDDE
jgi:hypothetical protein